jgi:hypothetical protein
MQRDSETEQLLNKLRRLRVEGPGRGGPFVGIQHNPVTRQIVAKGRAVVPLLVKRLESGDAALNEAIYIVFCLRQLKATEAQAAVRALKRELDSGHRFPGRDMTLDMQITYYLRELDETRKTARPEDVPSTKPRQDR